MKLTCAIITLFFLGLHGFASGQEKSRYCMSVRDEAGASIPQPEIKSHPRKRSRSQIKYKFNGNVDGQIDVEVIDGIYNIEIKVETFNKVVLKNQLLPYDPRMCIDIRLKSKIPPHKII